jgi:hypothetical protein
VCIFATGPAGCNFPARKFLKIAQGVRASVKGTLIKLDTTIDSLVEMVLRDDDEDILDTITRIAGKTGSSIKRVGSRLATRGARMIQDRLGY